MNPKKYGNNIIAWIFGLLIGIYFYFLWMIIKLTFKGMFLLIRWPFAARKLKKEMQEGITKNNKKQISDHILENRIEI
ncbi:hypothetical protein [Metamycoplasma equirhinis]|uniref:hypothetical protein n=1 Tax=Metamycoplasma equirhinis TaxID=92402 RepID=UPI0035937F3E